jgi:LacI family transcriptional regulator
VTDVMALGALAALREAGISVPWDIAVAGFDDIPSLRDVVPALTTARLPMTAMGVDVVGLAFADGPGDAVRRARVRSEVVLRDSTRRPG